jgi:DNA-binding response OmpR family regulator
MRHHWGMALTVVLLSDQAEDVRELLPAFPIAPYRWHRFPLKTTEPRELIPIHPDLVLVDARAEVGASQEASRRLAVAWEIGLPPVVVVVSPETISIFRYEAGADDFLLSTATTEEISVRLALAARRAGHGDAATVLKVGELIVNPENYQVYVHGRPLDLTYKEFELLKFLAQRPGRVCDRDLLLREVWGYDYFGGTRTVDVHVRRLRAKLGAEHEALIETIRNVGYRLAPRPRDIS